MNTSDELLYKEPRYYTLNVLSVSCLHPESSLAMLPGCASFTNGILDQVQCSLIFPKKLTRNRSCAIQHTQSSSRLIFSTQITDTARSSSCSCGDSLAMRSLRYQALSLTPSTYTIAGVSQIATNLPSEDPSTHESFIVPQIPDVPS